MKKIIGIRALSVLLALVLVSVVIVPAVSAEKTANISAFFNEMGGKEVSTGEYLEVVNPDYFSRLTEDQKAQFYAMKVTVPDLSQDVTKTSGKCEAKGTSQTKSIITYSVWNTVDIGPIPYGINWFANSRASCIFPDMHVTAQLFYSSDENSWSQVDTGSANGYWTNFVETLKVKWFPSQGYYKVVSSHWGTFPAGAIPQAYSQILQTGSMYYS
ncbi:MAG: hypothetical protein U9N40_00980 [Euryarchaeota archaeon]|nr:hypothetical protein [Euryarchaeota archaeon]